MVIEAEARAAICGDHGGGLAHQQTGKNDAAAGFCGARNLARQINQRSGEDVGDDEIEARVSKPRVIKAVGRDKADCGGAPVGPGIVAGNRDRRGIDVAGQNTRSRQRTVHADGQNTRTAAQIQHVVEHAASRQLVDGQQAAVGGGVMRGAERLPRIDQNGSWTLRNTVAVMAAMNGIATSGDGWQCGL